MKTKDSTHTQTRSRFGLRDVVALIVGFALINLVYEALDALTATVVVLCVAVAVLTGLVVLQEEPK